MFHLGGRLMRPGDGLIPRATPAPELSSDRALRRTPGTGSGVDARSNDLDDVASGAGLQTVLLIAEAPLLRDGLVDVLQEKCEDIAFIAIDPSAVIAEDLQTRPDLIIINVGQEKIGGKWLHEQMERFSSRFQDSPILLISELEIADEARRAIESGFAGFVPSTQSSDQLVAAIRVMLAGGRFHLSLNLANGTSGLKS
jgi:CheY-like chemotaxis protein